MPKKKSLKTPAQNFIEECDKILAFVNSTCVGRDVTDTDKSWIYDHAIIRLYREFEQMLLECLIAGLNQDNSHLSESKGLSLPKHLTDELCEYLIKGDRYFDFKGRKDILKKSRYFLGEDHFLTSIFSNNDHDMELQKLIALRNFAAHDSVQAKKEALKACNLKKMGSSGSFLKKQKRLDELVASLRSLAEKIVGEAPY